MNCNKCDVGWMCHVVPLRKNKEVKEAPPISQIPLIGLMDDRMLPKDSVRTTFRATDTPFVRLAKMGGRKDLLCFRENDANRGYKDVAPSCDWYYLEDNAFNQLSREVEKEKYVFKVPSYMMSLPCKKKQELTIPIPETTPPALSKRLKWQTRPLPDTRPGYSEYNKPVNKIDIARRTYIFPDLVKLPKKALPNQPESMAQLLSNQYVNDYDVVRKQYSEVKSLYQDRKCCVPTGITQVNVNEQERKAKIKIARKQLAQRQKARSQSRFVGDRKRSNLRFC